MTTVVRRATNPVSEMLDWLEGSAPWGPMGEARYIRVEDFVDENTFVVRAELPGVDPDKDIEVAVVGDVLTIRGERREEERDRNHSEFHYGSFSRSVRLPRGTTSDDVSATYGDGVLEVRLPMRTAEQAATKVPVQRQPSETGSATETGSTTEAPQA